MPDGVILLQKRIVIQLNTGCDVCKFHPLAWPILERNKLLGKGEPLPPCIQVTIGLWGPTQSLKGMHQHHAQSKLLNLVSSARINSNLASRVQLIAVLTDQGVLIQQQISMYQTARLRTLGCQPVEQSA